MNLILGFFLLQAVSTGVVTGTVRTTDGKPAQSIRIYAIALRDAVDAAQGAPAFEGLAETDTAGRYRLAVPPGRYYIAAGSVDMPTYYPDTTNPATANPVTIAAGLQVDGIDFSAYVAPQPRSASLSAGAFPDTFRPPPAPAFTLAGTIRLADGSPARGMEIVAIPWQQGDAREIHPEDLPQQVVLRTRSNSAGRFRFVNVRANDYYVFSGTPDAVSIYPGTSDLAKARLIMVSSQSIDKLDFTVSGNEASGRVLVAADEPAAGASIRIRRSAPVNVSRGLGEFLSATPEFEETVAEDGSFVVVGLSPGDYTVEASAESAPVAMREFVLGDGPVRDLDLRLQIASISGRFVFNNGKPVSGIQDFGSIVVSTVKSAEESASTIFRVSDRGTFGGILDPGEYDLTLPYVPPGYNVLSITAGGHDLLNEPFKMTASAPLRIEVLLEFEGR